MTLETDRSSKAEALQPRRKLTRIAVMFGVFVLSVVVFYILGSVLMSTVSLDSLQHARNTLNAAGHWFAIVRLMFIATLIGFWVPINRWLAGRFIWSDAYLTRILSRRWQALGVLLFVELAFMQSWLVYFFDLFDGVSQ